jgi:hypothetical protein
MTQCESLILGHVLDTYNLFMYNTAMLEYHTVKGKT